MIATTGTYGLVAPKGMPAAVVATLHAAVTEALRDPEVLRKLAVQGLEPLPSSPEDFAAYLRAEATRWARVVRAAGITAE